MHPQWRRIEMSYSLQGAGCRVQAQGAGYLLHGACGMLAAGSLYGVARGKINECYSNPKVVCRDRCSKYCWARMLSVYLDIDKDWQKGGGG
jgi:hypothetical protein